MLLLGQAEKRKEKHLDYGDVVVFPTYKTSYVVHVADRAAIKAFKGQNFDLSIAGNAFQLYRIDGLRPYREKPFTYTELEQLIENLGGVRYPHGEYNLQLVKKED